MSLVSLSAFVRKFNFRLHGVVGLITLAFTVFALSNRNYFCLARISNELKVQLEHGGSLIGRYLTSHNGRYMRAFLGIPYAKPPVGELRFKNPVPYDAWEGERSALNDPPICTQRDPFRRDAHIEGDEDCLYLNVYTPMTLADDVRFPVMVWFHGGGWTCGAGIRQFYGPEFLLDHDVILVTANFRLGPLGFLSTETLDCPGNFGLKDQVEVLKWVQQHIEAFNGNAKSVTIFGESAGGASLTYHMLSNKSKGLFHKGISQSGTYFNSWAQPAHKGVAAKRALKVAQIVGCNNKDWPTILSCLREKNAEDIVATVYDFFEWDHDPMIPFPPVVEPESADAFLSMSPRAKNAAEPHGFSLPLIIGATADEGLLKSALLLDRPTLLDEFKEKFQQILPIVLNYDHQPKDIQNDITQQIEKFYFGKGHNYNKRDHQNLTNLFTDGWFYAGIDEYMRMRIKANRAETFVYLFEHKGTASFTELFKGGYEDHYGACHAEELQYLFPIGSSAFPSAVPSVTDQKLRESLSKMWINFAQKSHPTADLTELPTWQPTDKYPISFVRIGSKTANNWTSLRKERGFFEQRLKFWEKIKPHLPNEESPNNNINNNGKDEL